MEVPVWALSGISKQFLEGEFSEIRHEGPREEDPWVLR
jgi:hypothetical protein